MIVRLVVDETDAACTVRLEHQLLDSVAHAVQESPSCALVLLSLLLIELDMDPSLTSDPPKVMADRCNEEANDRIHDYVTEVSAESHHEE